MNVLCTCAHGKRACVLLKVVEAVVWAPCRVTVAEMYVLVPPAVL